MIPLNDVDRRPCRFPIVTTTLIAINAVVFVIELAGGARFVERWAFRPADILAGRDLITVLTAMFMHGGYLHILGNMFFLWAFGPEIEDVMGRPLYLLFYLLGGVAATLAQTAVMPTSTVPNLGASGAIAAVMGAFIITFPHDRIRTLLFIFFFVTVSFVPAIVLIGLWFVLQLLSGFGALASEQTGGVAYMAHVGGFLFGLILGRLFEVRARHSPRGFELCPPRQRYL